MSAPVKTWSDRNGALMRLRLSRPETNIIDADMTEALTEAFRPDRVHDDLKAVLLDAEGPNFSFGASVEEHLPDQCAAMLKGFHALIMAMVAYPVPILIAARGHCLGGGLEVAMAGHLLFVAGDARLGQPEIKVGVFAPAASSLLPRRMPRAIAEAMLYGGAPISGARAVEVGLANAASDDPTEKALKWFDGKLAGLSASVLRYAVKAARLDYVEAVRADIANLETLYLDGLMKTRDATEGLHAFLERRPAKWENR